jgi:hypothetical protein
MKIHWLYLLLVLVISSFVFRASVMRLETKYETKLNTVLIDVEKLVEENTALRKVIVFEKTFLPYFSDETKDKLLATEGCLSLGG